MLTDQEPGVTWFIVEHRWLLPGPGRVDPEGIVSAPARDQVYRIAAHQALDAGHLPVGWVVINGTKAAVSMKGRHYSDYSVTHAEIGRWSWRWQLGWACCEPSQDWVLDFDGGRQRTERFHAEHLVPRTAISLTGRPGGMHAVFRGSGSDPWPRDGGWSAEWPNVQVRSCGFVAVAPSVHPNGTHRAGWTITRRSAPARCCSAPGPSASPGTSAEAGLPGPAARTATWPGQLSTASRSAGRTPSCTASPASTCGR